MIERDGEEYELRVVGIESEERDAARAASMRFQRGSRAAARVLAPRGVLSSVMYAADGLDRVILLEDLPQSSIGAPCPLILQDEHSAVVGFYVEVPDPNWTGQSVRIVDAETSIEPAAFVRFRGVRATMFGPPNDEAFQGHPLAARGLQPYSAAEVRHSSWIRILERMNSVHPNHRPEAFAALRHFVLAFHDSTFECVASRYDFRLADGPLNRLVQPMLAFLREPEPARHQA